MWHKTLLLLSVLLSFTSAEHSYVQNDKRFNLAVQGNALVPAFSGDSDNDFQASHAVHLKTSNGIKLKLLLSLPPDLQPVVDDNEENSNAPPTIPLPPKSPTVPVEDNPTPELPADEKPIIPKPPAGEGPLTPVEDELPSEQTPSIPKPPSVPSEDGSSSVIPITFKTINGVNVKLHVNIPPEFQHIIEAHQSIHIPKGALPQNPIPLPIPKPILPKPEPIDNEPTVPNPEAPEENPQNPIVPKPEPIEDEPETPTVPNPETPEENPQKPIIPRPEPIPEEPIAQPPLPEQGPIGLEPVMFETQNGIKLKLFVDVPAHLASLIGIEQSVTGLVPNIPGGRPTNPGNENPSLPGVETPTHPELEVPETPQPEVPDTTQPEVPEISEPEVQPDIPSDEPQQPETPVVLPPQTPGVGGIIKVPDPSDSLPEDQHITFSTEGGVQLRVKVNSPARARHLVQQQSEVTLVNN